MVRRSTLVMSLSLALHLTLSASGPRVDGLPTPPIPMGCGQPASDEPQADEQEMVLRVATTVRRLSSSSRAERYAAEQALRELGPEGLPWLPESQDIDDPHAREVVLRLRKEWERLLAGSTLEASLVTFPESLTWEEVPLLLEVQTGNRVVFDAALDLATDPALGPRQVELAGSNETITFWEAIEFLSRQFPAEVERLPDGEVILRRFPDGSPRSPVEARSAYRVSATPCRQRENFIDPELYAIFRTHLRIDLEPRLTGLFLQARPDDVQITTGDLIWQPLGGSGRREFNIPRSRRIEWPLDLKIPLEQLSRLTAEKEAPWHVDLTGRVALTMAAGFRTFEFPELTGSEPQVRRYGGLAVTLESLTSYRDQSGTIVWRANVTVSYEQQPPPLDSYQLWVFSNDVRLVREDGTIIPPQHERQVTPAEGGALRMNFLFIDPDLQPELLKLVYEAPTQIVEVPLEFQLNGIPILPEGGSLLPNP